MLKQFITKEVIQGILRHVLTVVGGILIAKGLASTDKVDTITKAVTSPECIGAVIALIGVAKSCMAKQPAKPATPEPLLAPKQQP